MGIAHSTIDLTNNETISQVWLDTFAYAFSLVKQMSDKRIRLCIITLLRVGEEIVTLTALNL